MKPTSLIDSASAWPEPILGSDKRSHEIFSLLESRFLFGPLDETLTLDCCGGAERGGGGRGRVRILSIDGGGGGELAAAALARLEAKLREVSGNPSARVVDFFDLAAGSGAGAVLAAALFARGGGGASAASAAAALAMIESDDRRRRRRRRWRIFGRRSRAFERVFGEEATMRDAAKPLLLPCHDAATGAPYAFSRSDAAEGGAFDFLLRDACAAAYGGAAAPSAAVSVDGGTRVLPAPATATASPAATAVTHALHNKREFPFVAGLGDLLVVSIGNGGGGGGGGGDAAEELLRIAGAAQADVVDQALAFAFRESGSAANYVRIQGDGVAAGRTAEATLAERGVESVLFRGRRMTETTNGERLDWASGELVKEEERRRRSKTRTVLIKPIAAVTPRTSSSASASSESAVTTVSGASSASL